MNKQLTLAQLQRVQKALNSCIDIMTELQDSSMNALNMEKKFFEGITNLKARTVQLSDDLTNFDIDYQRGLRPH